MKIISKRGRETATKNTKITDQYQITELLKCATDPLYFISKHIRVDSPTGPRHLTMEPYHNEYIGTLQATSNVIAMMPRQSGMTTMSLAYILWEALFNQYQNIVVTGANHRMTDHLMEKLDFMLRHIPAYLRPTTAAKTRTMMQFANGSVINVINYTKNTLKGRTLTRLYCDSFAVMPNNTQIELYREMASTLAIRGKVVMASTPTGKANMFAAAWNDAFHPASCFTPFKRTVDDMGFTTAWKQITRNAVGENTWQQEYMCEFI